MNKKVGTVFKASLICLICLFGMTVTARADYQYGDFLYYINNGGTVTMSEWTGTDSYVVIPSSIDNCPVTTLGRRTFNYCETNAWMPDSNLEYVEIPDTVTSLGHAAFYWCVELKNVELPYSITEIADWTFGYSGLNSIEIPDTVTYIGEYAFFGTKLEYLEIPDSVTYIGEKAFASTLLKTAVIPASVNWIGEDAFDNIYGCTFYVEEGSYAEQYFIDNEIRYEYIEEMYEEETYDDETYDDEAYEYDDTIFLEDYLYCSFDEITEVIPDLEQTEKDSGIEKWGNDVLSITGTDHNNIVRIRLSGDADGCCVYFVTPGMDADEANEFLNEMGLYEEAFTEDGWYVFSSEEGILVAYDLNEDNTVNNIYVAAEGYLSISY